MAEEMREHRFTVTLEVTTRNRSAATALRTAQEFVEKRLADASYGDYAWVSDAGEPAPLKARTPRRGRGR